MPHSWFPLDLRPSSRPSSLLPPGRALNFLLHNSLTKEAGARKDFPKVLVVITDGKSDDPVEEDARKLRGRGVEVFVLGACSQFTSYVCTMLWDYAGLYVIQERLHLKGSTVAVHDVFTLGVGQAEEAEMKLIASTPHRNHVYSVASFEAIRSVQRQLISQVCAGVEDQLSSLVSGDEGETP